MKLKKRAEKLALFQQHGLGVRPAVLVAESLGMTEDQLVNQCQYYRISTAYKNRRWSPSDIAKMSALRALGMKWSEIGEQMNRSPKSCAVTYGKLKMKKKLTNRVKAAGEADERREWMARGAETVVSRLENGVVGADKYEGVCASIKIGIVTIKEIRSGEIDL